MVHQISVLCYMMLQEVCILHVGLQNGYRVYAMLLQCLCGKHKLGDDDELSFYMYHVKHMTCAKCGPSIYLTNK